MSEKKMAGVFLWSLGREPGVDGEKRKNENLIVVAQSGGKPFSWDVFPNSMRGQSFDPEYAERLAEDLIRGSENMSRIDLSMEIPLYEYVTEDFPWWCISPGGVDLIVLPLMLAAPPLEVIAAVERMRTKNDVRSPQFAKNLGDFVGRFMDKAEEKFRKDIDGEAVVATMPEPAEVSSPEVSSPSPVSPLKTLHELDTAAGRVAIVEPESAVVPCALPSPGFVAVPLPDDGKPVLDYCRKPGWYLTRGAGAVDVTYNVGTGVDPLHQHCPWVHFEESQGTLQSYVFYDVNGKAWLKDPHIEALWVAYEAYDIVMKYDNPAAEMKEAGPATANDVPDLTIEQIQRAVGPDCVVTVNFTPKNREYRCTADAEYRLLEKGEVIQEGDEIDCCVNPMKDDAKWRPVSARAVGDTAPDPAYPSHRIFRRKVEKDTATDPGFAKPVAQKDLDDVKAMLAQAHADLRDSSKIVEEMDRALGGEKHASVDAREKCDMLELKNQRLDRQLTEASRERDSLAGKFGTAMAQRDIAREALERAEKDVADVKATLGKRDAECDNLRREVERLNAELHTLKESEDAAQHFANGVRCDVERLESELAKLQAEREPRDNGDGTVTALLPVTYAVGFDVVVARVPRKGDRYVRDFDGEIVTATADHGTACHPAVRLILRPAPKPPEPVAWEAPLADGHWLAEPLAAYGSGDVRLPWGVVRDLVRPSRLGCYRFTNGVGTLIEESRKEGSE